MSNLVRQTLVASAARTTSADSGFLNLQTGKAFTEAVFELDVTAQSGTTPTLNVYIQSLLPDGVNWDDVVAFTQIAAATGRRVARLSGLANTEAAANDAALAAGSMRSGPFGPVLRVKWVIAGTTPSYTFSVSADLIETA